MGIFSNSLSGVGSSEAAGLSINNEGNLMSDYEFIHCFRRDSNKVQNYLKVLKCRIVPANSCWIFKICNSKAVSRTSIVYCLWTVSKIIYKGLYHACGLIELLTEKLDSDSSAPDFFSIVIGWKIKEDKLWLCGLTQQTKCTLVIAHKSNAVWNCILNSSFF